MPSKIFFVFFFLILLLSLYIYIPGLSGTFHLDDYSNLIRLSKYQPSNSVDNFYHYLSIARPLSFFTFFINDFYQMSTPYGYIYTNLILHLITGSLLIGLSYKISIILNQNKKKAQWIALLSGAFWLTHPLMVSTTLYIVQRMTILSALFVIASLISYVHGRELVYNNQRKGYWWLIPGVIFFSILAYASKENAVLIPVFLLIFEVIIFQHQPIKGKLFRYLKYVFIYIPVLIIIIALFYMPYTDSFANREYSPYERFLTEFRILIDYLLLIFLPKIQTSGLFYDNYPISTSLIQPIRTLISALFIIFLVLLAYLARKKQAVLSLAILFFFSAHLIESTALNLELFFEHRNYLPSIFIFFALAFYIIKLHQQHKKISVFLSLILLTLFSSFTYSRSSLWGQPITLMETWAKINPTSPRIYREGSVIAAQYHRPDVAEWFLKKGIQELPDNVILRLQLVTLSCQKTNQNNINKIHKLLSTIKPANGYAIFQNLEYLTNLNSKNGPCKNLYHDIVYTFLNIILENQQLANKVGKQKLYYLLGMLSLSKHSYPDAYDHFIESYLATRSDEIALKQAAILASNKQYILALRLLHFAKRETPHFANSVKYKDLEQRLQKQIEKPLYDL